MYEGGTLRKEKKEAAANEAYVKLYIKESHIIEQGLEPPKTICGESPVNGVFNIRIDELSTDGKTEEALGAFLMDIYGSGT